MLLTGREIWGQTGHVNGEHLSSCHLDGIWVMHSVGQLPRSTLFYYCQPFVRITSPKEGLFEYLQLHMNERICSKWIGWRVCTCNMTCPRTVVVVWKGHCSLNDSVFKSICHGNHQNRITCRKRVVVVVSVAVQFIVTDGRLRGDGWNRRKEEILQDVG